MTSVLYWRHESLRMKMRHLQGRKLGWWLIFSDSSEVSILFPFGLVSVQLCWGIAHMSPLPQIIHKGNGGLAEKVGRGLTGEVEMPGAVSPAPPNRGWARTLDLNNPGSAVTSWKMRTQLQRGKDSVMRQQAADLCQTICIL